MSEPLLKKLEEKSKGRQRVQTELLFLLGANPVTESSKLFTKEAIKPYEEIFV